MTLPKKPGGLEDLSLLKDSAITKYPKKYDPSILECFDNRFPEHSQMVTLNCVEFTTMCEISGQPDFGKIYVNYVPDKKLVESKSLKLYLFGFRNHRSFHEHAVNTIGKDLVNLLKPKFLEVKGEFLPRGGISIDPYFVHSGGECESSVYWRSFAQGRLLARNQEQLVVSYRK